MNFIHSILRNQSGNAIMIVAISLPVLLGFGAITVDIGHAYVVRNELQNGADAAALAGVNALYQQATVADGTYDWVRAKSYALKVIKLNYADGSLLKDADITAGYWDSKSNSFNELPYTPKSADLPAIKVIVSKQTGRNGGLIKLSFGTALNLKSPPISASAIAILSSPSSIAAGGMVPLVVSSCIFNASWDFSTTPPSPKLDGSGNPITWSFGPGMSGGSSCGDQSLFTAFDDKKMADPSGIASLFSSGNLRPLALGAKTYVLDQADQVSKEVLPTINACSAAGDGSCEYVTMPVVAKTDGSAGDRAIVAFACVRIISTQWGENSMITAQLSTYCKNHAATGIGPPGTVYRTSLVQ